MVFTRWSLLVVFLTTVNALLAGTDTVYYGFETEGDGYSSGQAGIALAKVDPSTGEFKETRILFDIAGPSYPDKIRLSASGKFLGATLLGEDGGYVIHTIGSDAPPKWIHLGFEPDEHRPFGDSFVIGGSKGNLVMIDGDSARITNHWNSRLKLDPTGHRVEDIRIWPEIGKAALSFQKDSSKGKHLGSRFVWIDLPNFDQWIDLPLPRTRPDLHITGNLKEAGPNPEVIKIEPSENTLVLTLDLYGALWIADLDASLEGKWQNETSIPTAPDTSWGNTFPDRVGRFVHGGKIHYLVINSGEGSGYGIFRLHDRRFVGFQDGTTGAEEPIYFPDFARLATVVSGKIKVRGAGELNKFFEPSPILRIFRIDEWKGEGPIPETMIDLPGYGTRIVALSPHSPVAVLAVDHEGYSASPASLMSINVDTGEILDQIESPGRITCLSSATQ